MKNKFENIQTVTDIKSNLDFNSAVDYMKQGYYIRRKINSGFKNSQFWKYINEENEICERQCYIYIFDETNTPTVEIKKFNYNDMVFSAGDILSTDWIAEKIQIK